MAAEKFDYRVYDQYGDCWSDHEPFSTWKQAKEFLNHIKQFLFHTRDLHIESVPRAYVEKVRQPTKFERRGQDTAGRSLFDTEM